MNIKEDYVSYEVAKLLKEKGFDWDCITYYVDSEPDNVQYSMLFENNTTWEKRCCSAPTLQMVCKWLREMRKVNIEIHYNRFGENYKYLIIYKPEVLDDIRSLGVYYSYEEAVEAAIKYTLKNLIIEL